ncbi:MAG: hypothetical protein A2Y02_03135 [Omnitrophica bacterium GWA2_52_12]|nr:MAG: hypothetical protein A2Y02_03135 [Omnitrophica bacterium GWA2_52_12]
MKKMIALLGLALLFTASPAVWAGKDEGMHPASGFFIPDGDAVKGRAAFERLKCATCHRVEKDAALAPPVAAKEAPKLGKKQGHYSRGWIANSIVSPSHTVAWDSDGQADDSDLSRMGDFTEAMTVRELIDLVAYIKSLGAKRTE